MDGVQLIASIVSGGLAGGCISTIANRIFYRRALRTKLYPILNDFCGAYVIRIENPSARYWRGTIGDKPAPQDADFIDHRSHFISSIVEFNELEEARDLRHSLLANPVTTSGKYEQYYTVDLLPEYNAACLCFEKVHKKLKLS